MRRVERMRLRNDILEGVVARMADLARGHLTANGFCTDDHFRAAGFSAAAVQKHGDRARHRAALAMSRAAGEGRHATAGTVAGGNQRGEME